MLMDATMKTLRILMIAAAAALATGCERPADVASRNLSVAADNFQIARRIIFYNGITGDYMLSIEGLCALGNNETGKQRTVTCKVGPNEFKKHYLGLSENVTYFAEQLRSAAVDTYQYKVIFRPTTIIPDFEMDISR